MNYQEFQKMLDISTWQRFEKITGQIFEYHNFDVDVSTVISNDKTKRQIDVIASKGKKDILVDCKRWNKDRYKSSAIKKAAEKHAERTEFYRKETGRNAEPILVTLYTESVKRYSGVPVVPIKNLNRFILENLF